MISKIFAGLLLLCVSGFGVAHAQAGATPKGVVELFTSQGCRSCPPADRALESLIRQGDVVALAYHVDYWNYMGWADTLASKENTARQYAYARSFGRSGVYTPQAVINGREQVKGTDAAVMNQRLETLDTSGSGLNVDVDATMRGDELSIKIGSGRGKADVVVVYFQRRRDVDVLKGENQGKTITYWNSVTDVQTVGMWHGGDLEVVLPAKLMKGDKSDGCAILLQASNAKGEPSAILGATVLIAP
ncbi:DUF1223 domain-containing protein [Agrobacterium sp. a22-2]|uniref:DUF1223 domain-containing protein n=1 Tax=Agrobacterium sp. a22-2 TaxID=2283840 RepID=UPI001444B0B6|nr:thioredoxin family protein [Agrobacterium sp. a22-2]NKN36932.1 DUF1223 domain-containing protein [Agrobacterium sp. a22-2]